MNIFLNRDGSCQKVVPSHIYQGSAAVNTITVVAPFDNSTALAIAFRLPSGANTAYQPMSYNAAVQPGASEGVYFWTYAIPEAITENAGSVGVSLNAVSASNNQTSYQCNFEVEESIVPTEPTDPNLDTWNSLLVLYQQNAAAIANFAQSQVPIGTVTVNTLTAGSQATVSVAWNATTAALDFTYGIPQGEQGLQGIQGEQGEQGEQGVSIISVTLSGMTLTINYSNGTSDNVTISGAETGVSTIGVDAIPTANSSNLITSGGVATFFGRKIWDGDWRFSEENSITILGLDKYKSLTFSNGREYYHGDFNVPHDELHIWRIFGIFNAFAIEHLYLQYNPTTGLLTYDALCPSYIVGISTAGVMTTEASNMQVFAEIYAG